MTSVGETLRRQRVNRHLELDQISKDLKISCRMLAAIEDERFDRLPGGVFSRSFVRQYARYLGVDETEIARQLEEMLEPMAPEAVPVAPAVTQTPAPAPIPISRMDNWQSIGRRDRAIWRSPLFALGLVVIAMLGCAGIYAWWQRAPHPISVHAFAPVPAPSPAPSPTHTAAVQAVSAVPASAAPVRVEMTAEEPAWVEIKSDGHVEYAGTLQANQTRTVDANTMVVLILGNAGGVTISLNGKPIGTVGGKGQVRNLQLTSGGFEIVPPKSGASLDDMDDM